MNSDKSTETKSWTYAPSLSDAPKHTVFGPRGEVVATVYHSKDRARLIAAAPALLKLAREYAGACIGCSGSAEIIRNKSSDGDPLHDFAEPCPECEHIRDGIDKATGEHS